ncbi:MAG TPA: thioredoxin-like domain-containing protein, partial [Anaerolineaceae bacterium]|nr:thioredoxin-like domain-containing protein [Anaerolineaceae bacterium]
MRRLKQVFDDELVIIGVHSAKFPSEKLTENIRQAVMQLGIHHPVVNDAGFQIWDAYSVRAWPTLVLIDPTGRIAGETAGEVRADDLTPAIQEIIDQHRDAIDRTPLLAVSESELLPDRLLHFPGKL